MKESQIPCNTIEWIFFTIVIRLLVIFRGSNADVAPIHSNDDPWQATKILKALADFVDLLPPSPRTQHINSFAYR